MIILLYTAIVGALVGAEVTGRRRAQYVLKPLAALGFCALGVWYLHLATGPISADYGLLILAALAACALGDVFLLSRDSQRLFQAGMLAFAIGHLIYAFAFYTLGLNPVWMAIAFIVFGGISAAAYRHMAKTLDPKLRTSVIAYNVIITSMVVTAAGTQNPYIITGALMFAASDAVVGQDRFVKYDPRHAVLISPLYFGAQVVFASSIASV